MTGGGEGSLVHLVTGGGESSLVHLVTGGGRVFRSVLLSFSTSSAYYILLSVLSVNCVWSRHTPVSGCVCVCV